MVSNRLSDYDKSIQKKSFVEHIVAAQVSDRPLIIHARGDAAQDMVDLLSPYINSTSNNELKILHMQVRKRAPKSASA